MSENRLFVQMIEAESALHKTFVEQLTSLLDTQFPELRQEGAILRIDPAGNVLRKGEYEVEGQTFNYGTNRITFDQEYLLGDYQLDNVASTLGDTHVYQLIFLAKMIHDKRVKLVVPETV